MWIFAGRFRFFGHCCASSAGLTVVIDPHEGETKMKSILPLPTSPELGAVFPAAPPLFANIVRERNFADHFAGPSLLVLGAIPVALFLLMAVLPPASTVCSDAEVTIQGTAPTHASIDAAPRLRAAEL